MELSIVFPVYNEEGNLVNLHKKLKDALGELRKEHEIIFVDDGSTDRSFEILSKLHKKDKTVKVIKFRRNFGQTAAILAGFQNSKGKIVVTMDADLQNDPADIKLLLDKMEEGYDVVSGWRYDRKDPFITKRLPSLFSNWFARKLVKLDIHDFGCMLKAYRREAVKNLRIYGEMHRYITAIIAANGYKVSEVKVSHHKRQEGESKYGMARLMKGMLDLLYIKFWSSYSTRPLHFFGFFGLVQYILSFLIFLEQLIKALIVKQVIVGPLFLIAVFLAIIGTQFVLFGFLSEILIRSYFSNTGEGSFIIEKILE